MYELDAKSGPLKAGDFDKNGDFGNLGKNCHVCNGETGEKSPASGDLTWMPKVAPWRLAILAKMVILAKLAILAKIARGLAIVAILTNQLLHLFATLHVCWFFLFIYAFKPIKVYINMHRTV